MFHLLQSTFISYGETDRKFAQRLYEALQSAVGWCGLDFLLFAQRPTAVGAIIAGRAAVGDPCVIQPAVNEKAR